MQSNLGPIAPAVYAGQGSPLHVQKFSKSFEMATLKSLVNFLDYTKCFISFICKHLK